MHPDIKEFWIKAGYTPIGGHSPTYIWEINIPMGGPLNISRIEVVCHGNKHRYNNEWYSEEEMLRIIKQKAFL
jgi:hypothetical protein